jgi:hypothetical protein
MCSRRRVSGGFFYKFVGLIRSTQFDSFCSHNHGKFIDRYNHSVALSTPRLGLIIGLDLRSKFIDCIHC